MQLELGSVEPEPAGSVFGGTVERTARVIEANGFAVDWPLWDRDAARCSPCHPGSNCH